MNLSPRFALSSALAFAFTVGLPACGDSVPPPQVPPPPTTAMPPTTSAVDATPKQSEIPGAKAEAAPAGDAPKDGTPKKVAPAMALRDVGFSTPESVLHDTTADVYLVSNINGSPSAADGNGFISRVTPDGKVADLKWIEGGKKGVKLDAPKGMAFVGDSLFVADITTVREFDRKTGAPKGEVKVPGSTFINDLTTAGTKVCASDSGIKFGDKGAEPTKTDAVWVIEKGKAKALAKGEDLGKPNGLLATDAGVWVVTFGSGELYRLDDKGAKKDGQKLPKGSLDGIVPLADGLLVSSWDASTVYRGKPGGTFEPAIEGVKSPADIGYDAKRGRVLIPLFMENAVEIYEIK